MLLVPEGSVDNDSLAEPLTSEAVPSVTDPEVNVTDPVGNAVPDLTIAVKLTDVPTGAGLIEETNCRVVAAWVTNWVSVGDVAVNEFESPL